jgi:hypothetical protein
MVDQHKLRAAILRDRGRLIRITRSSLDVPLLQLAAGPDPRQVTTVRHSKNTAAFPGRQDGPVKGMAFREGPAVPE